MTVIDGFSYSLYSSAFLYIDHSACGFQAAAEFCPHSVGHYLGMDTHDTHLVSKGLGLHPGMMITVEPGIYISENIKNVPERFAILSLLNSTVVPTHFRFRNFVNDCYTSQLKYFPSVFVENVSRVVGR